jgi:hypothetical protein
MQPLLGLRVQSNQFALQIKECKRLPSMLKPNSDCTVKMALANTLDFIAVNKYSGIIIQLILVRTKT